MNLHINNHIAADLFNRILDKLKSFEKHSTIFRNRLNRTWQVELKQAARIDSDQKAGKIEVSIPVTGTWERDPKMMEYVTECAEAILFECGNAERSDGTQHIKDQLCGPIPNLTLMAAGQAQAKQEAQQMFEYINGLWQAKKHTTVSHQAERDLMQKKSDENEFQQAFINTPHKADGLGLECLNSKERYAYEFISLAGGVTPIRNIMRGIVRAGSHAQGFRRFIDEFLNFSLQKSEFVAAYCTVMKVVELVGPQGCWIKHHGYDFTGPMMALARQTKLLPGSKTALRTWINRIPTEKWAAVAASPLAGNPYAVLWLI